MLVLLLLFELFEKNRLFGSKLIFFTILVSLISGGMITNPNVFQVLVTINPFTIVTYQFSERTFTTILLIIFSTLSMVWVLVKFIRMRRTTKGKNQRHLIFWLFLGIFMSQVLGSFAPATMEFNLGVSHTFGPAFFYFKPIGLVMVGYAFIKVARTPWLLQRQKVHLLLVYSRAGIPMYSKILADNIKDDDVQLLTGAMSAITAIFIESTKTTSGIQSITFDGRELHIIERRDFLCVLLAEYFTEATEVAHANFVSEFETRFAAELPAFTGNVNKFDSADEIAEKFFS
ncbi:MAG: hypothetical protein ACTSUE_11425 [Promethearchaeota archaeon]